MPQCMVFGTPWMETHTPPLGDPYPLLAPMSLFFALTPPATGAPGSIHTEHSLLVDVGTTERSWLLAGVEQGVSGFGPCSPSLTQFQR